MFYHLSYGKNGFFPVRNLIFFLCRLYGGMNYRRLGGGVGVIKMTHCESHIWWTSRRQLCVCSTGFWSAWLWSFLQLGKTWTNFILCRCLNYGNTKYFTCRMPSLHSNVQFCAEYLFLVLIYHGFGGCFFFFSFPPNQNKIFQAVKFYF